MEKDQWVTDGKAAFRSVFDGEPDCVSVAPGRVNLIGGHTDYNDGYVLPVAIDRHTVVAGRRRPDRTVVAHSQTLAKTIRFDLSSVEQQRDASWGEYVAGVIDALNTESSLGGMEFVITGDIPLGAGVSSSAALELSVGALVRDLFDLQVDDRTLADRCWKAETEFVGVECGIMDQYAAAFGEADHALFLDCQDQTHDAVRLSDDVRIVVIDTNVKHELAASAYNDRVSECQEGVAEFDALLSLTVTSLRDVSVEEFERHAESIRQPVRDRCEHVISENDRVRMAAEALESGDSERCGTLMFASHESLKELYEVSCPELDLVVRCAHETEGVIGARMTGGGFGGSVVALVRPDTINSFAETLHKVYPAETGIEPGVYTCRTSDGVSVSTSQQ
jgi:galactokinase